MCLYTKQLNPTITSIDVIVYKTLIPHNHKHFSPYWHYAYRLGELNTTSLGVRIMEDDIFIHEGFHACLTKQFARERHCPTSIIKVYKCVIPKGSKVYISDCGNEIVSDNLIVKRQLLFNIF